jgi:hypothetical protein
MLSWCNEWFEAEERNATGVLPARQCQEALACKSGDIFIIRLIFQARDLYIMSKF